MNTSAHNYAVTLLARKVNVSKENIVALVANNGFMDFMYRKYCAEYEAQSVNR